MSYAIRRDMHIHVYVFNRDILYLFFNFFRFLVRNYLKNAFMILSAQVSSNRWNGMRVLRLSSGIS